MFAYRLRRSPALWWALVLLLAALTAAVVVSAVRRAEAKEQQFGTMIEVAVAARPIGSGDTIEAADVVTKRLPAALLPESPVVTEAAGRVAVVPLTPGEPIVESKVAPHGLRGIAALLPQDHRALAVPITDGTPPLRRGDYVEVLATVYSEDGQVSTSVASRRALVLERTDDAVTIAVPAHEAPHVAFYTSQGSLTLALTTP